MKCVIISFFLTLLIVSCTKDKTINYLEATEMPVEIPDITTDESLLKYNNKTSLWSLNDTIYSGYLVSYHTDSVLRKQMGIFMGKRENKSVKWYPDGHTQEVAYYRSGKLYGEKKMWSADTSHILIAHLNYVSGKVHGEQKQWYKTGEVYKILHFNMGKEDGLQQAFRKNGQVYANYEAKKGRIFGLKKSALCYGLEDESIRYEK